jgi:hypothetical protein
MSRTEPRFIAPEETGPTAAAVRRTTAPKRPRLDVGGEAPLDIVNFRADLPASSLSRDRVKFATAVAGAALSLETESAHAIARALADPKLATRMIQAPTFIEEVVETATLQSVQGDVYTTELFPLLQPRTGGGAYTIEGPAVTGVLDNADEPLAALRLTFRNHDHLRDYMRQTVRETRRVGNKYDDSILARRVSRPVIAHAGILAFEDVDDELDIVIVRDGLTRLVSSYAARMMTPSPTPDDIAEEVIRVLLTSKNARAGVSSSLTQDYARNREAARAVQRAAFEAGVSGETVSEEAIRIGQTFTLPSSIYVNVRPQADSPLPPAEQFDDAIRAVVSAIHVEFKGWDDASERVEVGDRALHRARHAGDIAAGVVDLATGVIATDKMHDVFKNAAIPLTDLWRGIYIVAWMCHPTSFLGMKRELRSILGVPRITTGAYVSHLAPLVDRPWRTTKANSLAPARSAWANGGPIPSGALNADWNPVPVNDFTELIPAALIGDRDALLTLQVGGGIALVADKILTSNKGSKLGQVVPFRADVDNVVTNLGTTERGLYLLARAANAFDAKRVAVNSFTETELANPAKAKSLAYAYRVPSVASSDPSKLATDNAGVAQLLTEYEVVSASAPGRAAAAEKGQNEEKEKKKAHEPQTEVQRATGLRREVRVGIARLRDDLRSLISLVPGSDGTAGPAFETVEDYNGFSKILQEIQSLSFNAQPSENPEDTDEDDDEDGYDEDVS